MIMFTTFILGPQQTTPSQHLEAVGQYWADNDTVQVMRVKRREDTTQPSQIPRVPKGQSTLANTNQAANEKTRPLAALVKDEALEVGSIWSLGRRGLG